MSLEAAILELTEATKQLIGLRTEAIDATKASAKPGAVTKAAKAAKPATAEEGAGPDNEAAAPLQISTNPENRSEAEDETPDPVKQVILTYLSADEISAGERAARKAEVTRIMGKVGAKVHSEIPAAKSAAFIKAINTLISKGNIIPDEAEEAEEDLLG